MSSAFKSSRYNKAWDPAKTWAASYDKRLRALSPDPAIVAPLDSFDGSIVTDRRFEVLSTYDNEATLDDGFESHPFVPSWNVRSYYKDHAGCVAPSIGAVAYGVIKKTICGDERPKIVTFPSPTSSSYTPPDRCGDVLSVSIDDHQRGPARLLPPGLGISCDQQAVTESSDGLVNGRLRIGENLVRYGATRAFDTILENELVSPSTLAEWAAVWLRRLILDPHIQNGSRLHQRNSLSAVPAVASRICGVIEDIRCPVQVIVHALWFTMVLTRDEKSKRKSFLSIPIFKFLSDHGTSRVEDFLFRTFITCAMIGDKSVNDSTYPTKTWSRLSCLPPVFLNTMELFVLEQMNWRALMTNLQWKKMVEMLRSFENDFASESNSSAYNPIFSRAALVVKLDRWIAEANDAPAPRSIETHQPLRIHAPQPIRPMHQFFDLVGWCPEADPIVNKKPRIIGIAPGSDRSKCMWKAGVTAKDLLDSILGFDSTDRLPLTRNMGTSFCGPFGVVGSRLANSVTFTCANSH